MGPPLSLWWPGGAAWPRGWGSPLTGRGRGGDRGPEWTAEGLAAPARLAGLGGSWAGSWVRGELQAWAPVASGRAGAGRGLLRCHYRLSAGHIPRPCWLLPPRRPLNCLWAPWCLSTTGVGGAVRGVGGVLCAEGAPAVTGPSRHRPAVLCLVAVSPLPAAHPSPASSSKRPASCPLSTSPSVSLSVCPLTPMGAGFCGRQHFWLGGSRE